MQKVGIKVNVCNILHAKCTTLNFRETDCDIAQITNRQTLYLIVGNISSYHLQSMLPMICDFCIQPIGKFYRVRDFRTLPMVAIFKIVGYGCFPSVVSEVSEVVKPLNRKNIICYLLCCVF